MLNDQVYTLHVATYWSIVLCFATPTHLNHLEGKYMDFMLKFSVKVFIILYFLNMSMYLLGTIRVVSKTLFYTIPTKMISHKIKVTEFEISCFSFYFSLNLLNMWMDLVGTKPVVSETLFKTISSQLIHLTINIIVDLFFSFWHLSFVHAKCIYNFNY